MLQWCIMTTAEFNCTYSLQFSYQTLYKAVSEQSSQILTLTFYQPKKLLENPAVGLNSTDLLYLIKYPEPSGRLEQVCSLSAESKLNIEKQHSVLILLLGPQCFPCLPVSLPTLCVLCVCVLWAHLYSICLSTQ